MQTYGHTVTGQADNQFARGSGARVWMIANVFAILHLLYYTNIYFVLSI